MGINFHGHGGVVGAIIVEYATNVLIFVVYKFSWIKEYYKIHKNSYTTKFNMHTVCLHVIAVVWPLTLVCEHFINAYREHYLGQIIIAFN